MEKDILFTPKLLITSFYFLLKLTFTAMPGLPPIVVQQHFDTLKACSSLGQEMADAMSLDNNGLSVIPTHWECDKVFWL